MRNIPVKIYMCLLLLFVVVLQCCGWCDHNCILVFSE